MSKKITNLRKKYNFLFQFPVEQCDINKSGTTNWVCSCNNIFYHFNTLNKMTKMIFLTFYVKCKGWFSCLKVANHGR